MHEKFLSISCGSLTGCISSIIMTDKIMEVLFLSFIGGVVGWFGGRCARYIDRKCGNWLRCWFKIIFRKNGKDLY